jgi:hypothetical protein
MIFRQKHKDKQGAAIKIGDRIEILELPFYVKGLDQESRLLYKKTIGRVFKVEDIFDNGWVQIDVSKLSKSMGRSDEEHITFEPTCVKVMPIKKQ